MAFDRKRYVDVGPGPAEQLAAGLAEKGNPQPKETPRSKLFADIDAAIRNFERNPKAHAEQIAELRDLARELTVRKNEKRYASDPEAGEEALRETAARIAEIKESALADVRGGNGPEAPEEPMTEPASAEAGLRSLGEELTRSISEVPGRIASLDDERKKTALGKQLELLQVYQRVKPADRNPVWEQKVRQTLARIRNIERPRKERSDRMRRERRAPKAEAAVGAAVELGIEQRIQELAQQLRIEREAGGAEASKELDERIRVAGAQPFTSEADAIAREYDLERARLALQKETAAPAEAGPETPEILPEAKTMLIARAQEALAIIRRKIGMGKSSHIGQVLAYNIEQAQEKLASAKDLGISESGLERVRAITEKLEALAVGWERDKRKNWEKEVQQRSFELSNALTLAMPAEHRPAVVLAHGGRTEAFAAQPEAIPDAGAEAEEHAQAAAERHAKDDVAYLNRTLGLSLDSRKDNSVALREQGQKLGMVFADSVSQERMARQLREKIEFEGAPQRTMSPKNSMEAAETYDPEQEVGAPQEMERAEDAEVVAPVEAAYRKRTLAEFERESAEEDAYEILRAAEILRPAAGESERKERMHRELVAEKKELEAIGAKYRSATDPKERQELAEEVKAKGKEFFDKFEIFKNLN